MRRHEEASGTKYIDPEKFIKWKKKDPIRLFEKYLKDKKYLDNSIKKDNLNKIEELINPALDYAISSNHLILRYIDRVAYRKGA